MRILITTDVVGGVWSYTEELVDAVRARGHEVVLVALGGAPRAGHDAWAAQRPELRFEALPFPLEWMPEPEPGLTRSFDAVHQAVDAAEPDVVHLNQFVYGALDLGAPKLVVAHSDVLTWWTAVKREEPPDDPWFRRYRGWVTSGLRGADARVAPAGWIARQVEATYGVSPVQVVHNARSAAAFETAPGRRREPMVVAAGRLWDEAKGARDLVDAAPRLAGRGRVVVAGPVQHPAGGEDFPADSPGVEWAGELARDELRALLSRASIYAATSVYEPFGLAPLEAVLAGCALVAADIPTFRELWSDCAVFYPPGDAAALADAADSLLRDIALRDDLAGRARERALERYSPGRMAKQYEQLYELLVASC